VKHGYGGKEAGPIDVELCFDSHEITITITDEAPVFDPASVASPDLEAGWEDRAIGGLGWHLVRRVVDEVRHQQREGGGNVVTLVKKRQRDTP
jgi:serine/threonine-protein kinase RsbW